MNCAEGGLQRDVALTRLGNISLAPSRDVACALFRDVSLAAFRVSQKRELAQTRRQFRQDFGDSKSNVIEGLDWNSVTGDS